MFDTMTERKLPKFGIDAVWRVVRWSVLATAFTVACYFGVVTRLKANEEKIDAMRDQVTQLQQTAKSKESADADRAAIREALEAMKESIQSIDRRLDAIESRRR